MNIGIEINRLMATQMSGIGNYVHFLIKNILKLDRTNQYYFYYNTTKNLSDQFSWLKCENTAIQRRYLPERFELGKKLKWISDIYYRYILEHQKIDVFHGPSFRLPDRFRKWTGFSPDRERSGRVCRKGKAAERDPEFPLLTPARCGPESPAAAYTV